MWPMHLISPRSTCVNWTAFTPLPALFGGALIGVAVSMFLLATGRVAGISGIVGGVLSPKPGDLAWRVAFITGLLAVGLLTSWVSPTMLAASTSRGPVAMVVAGLVVGYGTRLGNGCTSGHGVCGLSRFSVRSLAATVTFMFTGMVTVTLMRVLGGAA
jgi:uncharacterized membrane protein YedE/YeeE